MKGLDYHSVQWNSKTMVITGTCRDKTGATVTSLEHRPSKKKKLTTTTTNNNNNKRNAYLRSSVSQFGFAVSGRALVQFRLGSHFSTTLVIHRSDNVRLCSSIIKETFQWLTSLPILMQEELWWRECSVRYGQLSPHLLKYPSSPVPLRKHLSIKEKK